MIASRAIGRSLLIAALPVFAVAAAGSIVVLSLAACLVAPRAIFRQWARLWREA